jgi:hypothetical protein
MDKFLAYVCILNTVLILISLKMTIDTVIELKSLQNSTHNVTWMPWNKDDDKHLESQIKDSGEDSNQINESHLNNIMDTF